MPIEDTPHHQNLWTENVPVNPEYVGSLGMSVLQNSLFDYNTALSQFLEARRQQHPSLGLGFFPVIGSASGSDTTDSLSPSPPAVTNSSKSFTIDAILGLRCKPNSTGSTVLDYSNPASNKKIHGKWIHLSVTKKAHTHSYELF